VIDRLVEWTAPARAMIGAEASPARPNGAQRARDAHADGASLAEIYRRSVSETRRTYAPQPAPAG
jgi:hypothetical protein